MNHATWAPGSTLSLSIEETRVRSVSVVLLTGFGRLVVGIVTYLVTTEARGRTGMWTW